MPPKYGIKLAEGIYITKEIGLEKLKAENLPYAYFETCVFAGIIYFFTGYIFVVDNQQHRFQSQIAS